MPETHAIFPFLSRLRSVDFTGDLPADPSSLADWNFVFHFVDGTTYPLDVRVDAQKTPWNLRLDLSPLDFELSWLAPFIRTSWGIPPVQGAGHLSKAVLSGPFGRWNEWEADVQMSADIPNLELPIDQTLVGVSLDLNLQVDGEGGKGTAKGTVDQVLTHMEGEEFRGFESPGLSFHFSTTDGEAECEGPWSAKDIWGSRYTGTFSLSSKHGYRVEARTDNLSWRELPIQLEGRWRAHLRVEDESWGGGSPHFEVALDGTGFRVGELDLSGHPVSLRFSGEMGPVHGKVQFDQMELAWEDSFQLDLSTAEWDGNHLHARGASLSGDLSVLSPLLPGLKIDPQIERFIHPQGWVIHGGILVQLEPSLVIEVEQGEIDTGKGIKGPIGFRYTHKNRNWSFQTPTLHLNLTELARELGLSWLEIKGEIAVQADLSGHVPVQGEDSKAWLTRAFFDGKVMNCTGRVNRIRPNGEFDQHLFSWLGANGKVSLDWNSASRRLESDILMDNFVWYSRPGVTDRPYRQTLRTGGARLKLDVVRGEEATYLVRKGFLSFGKGNPVEFRVTGKVEESGENWRPTLNVRIQGNSVPETPVFRCVSLKGSGIFQGTIQGNSKGNWLLNGKATLDGLTFKHIIAPVILQRAKGTFEVSNLALDEYVSESRWNRRRHRGLREMNDPHIVERAFERSKDTSPNLIVPRMTVGTTVFERVALRVFREGEFLFMNTASGQFAEGGFPVKMTGYFFFHPRNGVAYRVAGYTQRAPLSVALPLVGNLGLDYQAVEVRFFIVQDLFQEEVQTRYINLGIPIGGLKNIPGIGPAIFGWTPDLLQSREIIARKVGDGEWTILNPLTLGDATGIPSFILRDLPAQGLEKTRHMGSDFLNGFGEGVRDILETPSAN